MRQSVVREDLRAGQPEMGERIEHRGRDLAAMVQDALELARRRRAVLQPKVRLAPKVDGPEFRGGRVIVRPDRLEQLEARAASPC